MGERTIIRNAKVYSMDRNLPWGDALCFQDDKILAMGTDASVIKFADANTRILDAAGRRLMPAFNDAHQHTLVGGEYIRSVNLRLATSLAQMVSMLGEYVSTHQPGKWVSKGGYWDHESWPERRFPTAADIDPISPENPVLMRRNDGHVAVINSLALKLAGINRDTPDPQGGELLRDSSGNPTGVLVDTAMDLVRHIIPPKDESEVLEDLEAATKYAHSLGVTSMQGSVDFDEFLLIRKARDAGKLKLRLGHSIIYSSLPEGPKMLGELAKANDDFHRALGVKIFADGSLGAGSAAFYDEYLDRPGHKGLLIYPIEQLHKILAEVHKANAQIFVHAIGDRAVGEVLNGIAACGDTKTRRHRIEHSQSVRQRELPLFQSTGAVASVQPIHLRDASYAHRRLKERTKDLYRFRSFEDLGIPMAFGTDWYVEDLNPFPGLEIAVRRTDPFKPGSVFHPEQCLAIEDAARAYTYGSAYAEFAEDKKGKLGVGMLADIILLNQDIFRIPSEEISKTKVDWTILGGEIVYDRLGELG